MNYLYIFLFSVVVGLSACSPESKKKVTVIVPSTTPETLEISSGDILVSSSTSRDVKLFSTYGVYKATVLDLDNTTGQVPYGITYNTLTQEILVAVDSTTSRTIKAINKTTFAVRDFSASPALNNTLRGLAMLASGELLAVIAGGNRVEKLNGITGTQITAGAWPKSLQTGGVGVSARSDGTFTHCSSTADVVRLYDAAGTQTATAASGIAATTDVLGCTTDSSGNVYATFNGTTDTIRKYDPTLTPVWSYSNTVLLPNPTGLAVRTNGNVLVLDQTYNYILEVAADGSNATMLGADTDNMLSTPQFILVVP